MPVGLAGVDRAVRARADEHADRRRDAVGREADLRARPGRTRRRRRRGSGSTRPATSSQRSFCRMAHSSAPTWIGVPASAASRLPCGEAVDHRLDDVLDREALGRRQLRREAHLGVHDAVGGQVEGALAGHPVDRLGPLHHADGVRERLQVLHQRPGVGRLPEPAAEARRRRRPAGRGSRPRRPARAPSAGAGRRPGGRAGGPSARGASAASQRGGHAGDASSAGAPVLPAEGADAQQQSDDAPERRAPARPGRAPSCRPAPGRRAPRAGTPSAGPAPSTSAGRASRDRLHPGRAPG